MVIKQNTQFLSDDWEAVKDARLESDKRKLAEINNRIRRQAVNESLQWFIAQAKEEQLKRSH